MFMAVDEHTKLVNIVVYNKRIGRKPMNVVHHRLEATDQKGISATSNLAMGQRPGDGPPMGRSNL